MCNQQYHDDLKLSLATAGSRSPRSEAPSVAAGPDLPSPFFGRFGQAKPYRSACHDFRLQECSKREASSKIWLEAWPISKL